MSAGGIGEAIAGIIMLGFFAVGVCKTYVGIKGRSYTKTKGTYSKKSENFSL